MAIGKSTRVHLINSIRVDPARAESYPDFEADLRRQLASSARRFEKLKTMIAHLVRFTTDIRGVIDVDLLEERAGRIRPNMDVVRSLRLVKYILSTLIYLLKGDEKYVEDLKPGEAFFRARPRLADAVRTGADVDTVLLALYNESPRKHVADTDPRYGIRSLLKEILTARSGGRPPGGDLFFRVHATQFEEGMYRLTGGVLRLLFNVEEVETDMDIMLYLVRTGGRRPVRMKRVFADDVRTVHAAVDHVLFLLQEAARYVLEETRKDASFIQQILSASYVANVLHAARSVLKGLDTLDAHLGGMRRLESRMRISRSIREHTAEATDTMNQMMNGDAYRELLLLSRDMKECGALFFMHLQSVYGFYAALATRNRMGFFELLDRLEGSLRSHFATITRYLRSVPGLQARLDAFRRNYATITMIEEGRSDLYRTIIHEVSQVAINFTTSTERGKLFRRRLKAYEDFDLLYDPLYGDRIRAITDPIIRMRDTFPAQSRFNLGRFIGREKIDPDAMRASYRKIMRIRMFADAILAFHGSLRDTGAYAFDPAVVSGESAQVRRHLMAISGYCREYQAAHGGETQAPVPDRSA